MDGHAGGLLATGINSGVTGFGADLLILDDVVKDAAEADSAAHRCRVVNEYRSTLATRVHPGGPVLLMMTRWHEPDLAGELLDSEPDVWQHTNVPAMATAGVPDALAREPGATMTSALGFTPEHYAAARGTSGERAWATLYLGVPTAPAGGLVKCEWLDTWRLPAAPVAPIKTLVGVNPSDSSSGDSCGLSRQHHHRRRSGCHRRPVRAHDRRPVRTRGGAAGRRRWAHPKSPSKGSRRGRPIRVWSPTR